MVNIINANHTQDIFGQTWTVRRRVDSGQGFDLLYGVPIHQSHERMPSQHILDENLRTLILENLEKFTWFDIPITPKRRARLRRVVSSLRYCSIADWLERRAPNARVLWVHPEHIELPELVDINGKVFEPSAITCAVNDQLIWNGIPDKPAPGARHSMTQYVLTPALAKWIELNQNRSVSKLEQELSPISRPLIMRFLRRIAVLKTPSLQNWKEAHVASPHMHAHYIKDGLITDALGRHYQINSITKTQSGIPLLRGKPAGSTRKNGSEVIITPELATLAEQHQYKGGIPTLTKLLGIGPDNIKRIRKDLGLSRLRAK